jgi:predicted phosphodiesterase
MEPVSHGTQPAFAQPMSAPTSPPPLGSVLGIISACTLLFISIVAVGWPAQVRVASPRLGMPLIDRPGAPMEVRLATSLPFVLPSMSLSLEGPGGTERLAVATQRWEGADAVLRLALPMLPDGGYSLRVLTSTQNLLVPKAVFIRRDWPAVLRIAHIADLPPPGHEPLMRRFVAEMQQRKPDAVLVSGDINYTGTAANIDFIFEQLVQLNAPVIMTAGNHEREAWHRYLRVFGARDHRTDFGPLTILSLDSAHGRDALTPSTVHWLRKELKTLAGRTPVVQIHHPVFPPGATSYSESGGTGGFLRGHRRAFLDLCRKYQVAIVLSGHWHQNAVFDATGTFRSDRRDFPGTKFVVTTALGAEARKVFAQSPVGNGYRWIEFDRGALVSYDTDQDASIPVIASRPP